MGERVASSDALRCPIFCSRYGGHCQYAEYVRYQEVHREFETFEISDSAYTEFKTLQGKTCPMRST